MSVTDTTVYPATVANYLASVHRPGAFQTASWTTEVAAAAAHKRAGVVLTKEATATVRTGVEYANLAVNEGTETGPLPWGEWAVYPWLIVHKGGYYARLYTVDGSVRVVYKVNGEAVTREAFAAYLTPSAATALLEGRRPNGGTISVKLESVTLVP